MQMISTRNGSSQQMQIINAGNGPRDMQMTTTEYKQERPYDLHIYLANCTAKKKEITMDQQLQNNLINGPEYSKKPQIYLFLQSLTIGRDVQKSNEGDDIPNSTDEKLI